MDNSLNVKISDFGLSSVRAADSTGQQSGKLVGSPYYMAPEVLTNQEYSIKSDVYSFSVVVWEVISNQEPYKGMFSSMEEMIEGVTMDELRPPIPDWFLPGITQLCTICWNSSPESRLSFQDIVGQHWLLSISLLLLFMLIY